MRVNGEISIDARESVWLGGSVLPASASSNGAFLRRTALVHASVRLRQTHRLAHAELLTRQVLIRPQQLLQTDVVALRDVPARVALLDLVGYT